jgi:hypothetical protein
MSTSLPLRQDRISVALVIRHVALPALAPLALVALSVTPLTVISCRDRGLLALLVTAVSAVAAFVCIGFAFRERARGKAAGAPWLLSAAICALPLALLIGPLG